MNLPTFCLYQQHRYIFMLCHCTYSLRKWLNLKLFVQVKLSVALPGTAHDKSLARGHLCRGNSVFSEPQTHPVPAPAEHLRLTPGTTKNKFPQPHPLSCGSEDSSRSRVSERWLTRRGGTYLQSLNLDKRRRQERARSRPGDFSPPVSSCSLGSCRTNPTLPLQGLHVLRGKHPISSQNTMMLLE